MIRLSIGQIITTAVIVLGIVALAVVRWSDRNRESDRDG